MTTQAELDEMIANATRVLAEIHHRDNPPKEFKQTYWTGEQGGTNPDVVLCANPSCLKPLRNSKYTYSVGRPSDYCSDACKMKAYRQRKKALRNVQQDEKPISKRSNVIELSTAGKVIGVSGTVHRFPIAQQTVIKAPAPYIRSFDDLQSFFGGSK